MARVRSAIVKGKQAAKNTVKIAKQAEAKTTLTNRKTIGLHGKKIVTAAYNMRKAFGIPRLCRS
ncbi:hypothetical protein ONS95_005189 [Cadophora gregata]|uniref:uncharacterized protein n=1 Tax=Cadophora gregata TaxID=51156 RepID=UPI0026DB8736|nr:uncharacterized protein ONS95_005189 [Cadophora gregata]KAK0104926.1 hypothetical protein ONS95_005189 [Cadophora gregata]KAK0114992.1 hypothetical protein ONS96_013466 [Cadophora gregata f. sp. sojae]